MSSNIIYKETGDIVYKGTTFDEIYKLFLGEISNDYRINRLFKQDEAVARDMLQTWLIKAITYFGDCRQDLETNVNIDLQNFSVELTLTEKSILADLMILVWMEWNVNNITQMNLSLQDSDFNRHAESQNLNAKIEDMDKWREKTYHRISEYLNKEYDVTKWAIGEI